MTTHPCYTYHTRMTNCIKSEELSTRMCFEETEDWIECKSRRKHRAFFNFLRNETDKIQLYSLPKYDEGTDSFKDGVLPKDVDSYFDKPVE
eukprot:CAMPEP_0170488154 /NCGR_PEP_ID=MMETSP0208-20121228/6774_1 /TAXON_ID=197538 /ORGANISM="Strombidium inclinatum, Strain S3" /LENGTH=90 /DNA_ID=CAMNT_0010762639 /DNA_START=24 /DNA_END=296 /DNA_ORIENTATION=-